MIEQIPLLLATPIAKVVLDKFYEGVGNKLGEEAVVSLPRKVQQLGQLVWEKCLRGKAGADVVLQKAAKGSAEHQQKLTEHLHQLLEGNHVLKQEVQKLAEQIHLEIFNEASDMTQYNHDSIGIQNRDNGKVVLNHAEQITQYY